MQVTLTPADLTAFEDEIAAAFLAKQIHAPVHLYGGGESQLIDIFRGHVEPQDWLAVTWRSHPHCLLKGVPRAEVKAAILAGRSITLNFPQHKVISSAMVGGIAPIAVGLALGIQRKGETGRRKVVCFLGDMAVETGIVHEAIKYSVHYDLPILFVVEDNGLSVKTDTVAAWGGQSSYTRSRKVISYCYQLTRPHVGVGSHVAF